MTTEHTTVAPNPLPPGELVGQVALVTGGGSGLGRAITLRLAREGAHIAIFDINPNGLAETCALIEQASPSVRVLPIAADVCNESAVVAAFERTLGELGQLDIVVSNAGLIRAAPIEDSTLEQWDLQFGVLVTGYYLVARQAFRVWKHQGTSGRMVFITSKNAVVASSGASIYSAAKAAEQHLARCLAEEGGPFGIRVNCVMPDGVIRGTNIIPPEELERYAARHGVKPEDLDEFYRKRNTLKVNITPEDVAEAVLFLVSTKSAKTTGAALTVDGGVTAAYLR